MIRTPYDWPRPEIPYEGSELWPLTAMRDRQIGLEVIDTARMLVYFANGVVLPIIALFDSEGARVEHWEDASAYEFGNASMGYGRANCASDRKPLH